MPQKFENFSVEFDIFLTQSNLFCIFSLNVIIHIIQNESDKK